MTKAPLTTAELSELFHHYSPDDVVASEKNGAAFANDAYNLRIANGTEYVMRILKLQLPETVQREAEMQHRLAEVGIGTPHYLTFGNGKHIGEHHGKAFTLSERIPGEVPKTAPLELIGSFGSTLAQFHNALEGTKVPFSKMQWFQPKNVHEDLEKYDGELKPDIAKLITDGEQLFQTNLSQTLIHGDLWLGNVFAEGDEVTAVFDMETAEHNYRIIDLARTYLSMRLETEYGKEEIIDRLFSGYDTMANKPLAQEEKDSFGLAISYTAGVCALWHELNGTRYAGNYLDFGAEI
ncbi:MAG: homoserine kinase type [Patescibacteria group bacterium]|nr:homoserine kinase type [Patescibacteria group bacterium]